MESHSDGSREGRATSFFILFVGMSLNESTCYLFWQKPLEQSSHLHSLPQHIPALKHSQYFF